MEQTSRSFEAEYHDTSLRDGTYDVTFTLSEDAEDALFAAFDREISDHFRDGNMPDQKLHLLRRLCGQRSEHPPWIEAKDGKRTYDLELSEWDYHLLTRIIGESLSNVLGPDGAERYSELVEVWEDVTTQMQTAVAEEVIPEPDNGVFQCHVRDGQFRLYKNADGDEWYVCTDCETSFASIGDEHDCTRHR
jgi:hypothetical protein